MDTCGSTVRRALEQCGWSLDEAARRIGLSKSRLRELETGLSLKTRKPRRPGRGGGPERGQGPCSGRPG